MCFEVEIKSRKDVCIYVLVMNMCFLVVSRMVHMCFTIVHICFTIVHMCSARFTQFLQSIIFEHVCISRIYENDVTFKTYEMIGMMLNESRRIHKYIQEDNLRKRCECINEFLSIKKHMTYKERQIQFLNIISAQVYDQ